MLYCRTEFALFGPGLHNFRAMTTVPYYQDPIANPSLLEASCRVLEALVDLCRHHNRSPDQVSLIGLDAHTWPDAGLGIPEPGRLYAQTLTPGLIIRFQAGDTTYTYHTSLQGPPRSLAPPPLLDLNEDHPLIADAMLDLAQYLGVGYSQIKLDRTESPRPALGTVQASPAVTSTSATWTVWLRHGSQVYRYQGPAPGPLTRLTHPSPLHTVP